MLPFAADSASMNQTHPHSIQQLHAAHSTIILLEVGLQLRDYGDWYVREALKHCQPGDVAAAVAILSSWAAENSDVRVQSEPAAVPLDTAPAHQAVAADPGPSGSQVRSGCANMVNCANNLISMWAMTDGCLISSSWLC